MRERDMYRVEPADIPELAREVVRSIVKDPETTAGRIAQWDPYGTVEKEARYWLNKLVNQTLHNTRAEIVQGTADQVAYLLTTAELNRLKGK